MVIAFRFLPYPTFMAKEIKAIKCPQCGSTSKTEIKPDVYRCNNCQTEYYLDDDNVTVNYNHNYKYSYDNNNSNAPLAPQKVKVLLTVLAIVFAITFVSILLNAVFRKEPVNSNYVVSEVRETEAAEKEYDLSISKIYLLPQAELEKPVSMQLESRRYNAEKDKSKDGFYLGFYDVISGKRFAEQRVMESASSNADINVKTFSDGNTYLIMESELYVADLVKGKVNKLGANFFGGHKELQVGIATMGFVYNDFGDGLILMTNDGKKLYSYPLVKKLYTEDDFYDAQMGFQTLLPNSKEKTLYVFTGKSSDYPDEKRQLLKVRYKDNGGGPKDLLDNVSWGKDYGGSGIFTERDPYTKVLVSPYTKQRSRVLSWKDITPNRYYFSPEVLYGDDSCVLIQFKADANPKSGYKMQELNPQTGEPVWTKPLTAIIRDLTPYKSGYVAVTHTDSVVVMDFKGNVKP